MERKIRDLFKTSQFKRDVRRAHEAGLCTQGELQKVIDMLRADTPLPPHLKNHPLKGEWKPSWDCHVNPDLLLIYTKVPGELHLRRLASHSELFR